MCGDLGIDVRLGLVLGEDGGVGISVNVDADGVVNLFSCCWLDMFLWLSIFFALGSIFN